MAERLWAIRPGSNSNRQNGSIFISVNTKFPPGNLGLFDCLNRGAEIGVIYAPILGIPNKTSACFVYQCCPYTEFYGLRNKCEKRLFQSNFFVGHYLSLSLVPVPAACQVSAYMLGNLPHCRRVTLDVLPIEKLLTSLAGLLFQTSNTSVSSLPASRGSKQPPSGPHFRADSA